jgi:uncharacterized protein YaeQ
VAAPSTLFRFRLTTDPKLPALDMRVALHPSESRIFMVTRVLAYALNVQDGIEFTAGLNDPDVPAIRVIGTHGEILKWIDIGNPSPRRLHKSAKAAQSVLIYTYKDVERLKKEALGEKIYNADKIQIFAFDPDFLESLVETLSRDNPWQIRLAGNEIDVEVAGESYVSTLEKHSLA